MITKHPVTSPGNQQHDLNRFLFFIPDIFMTIRYPSVGAGFFMKSIYGGLRLFTPGDALRQLCAPYCCQSAFRRGQQRRDDYNYELT